MPAIKKTFRLTEETVSDLEILAERDGCSQTEAVQRAIRCAVQVPDTCHTPDPAFPSAFEKTIEILEKQLDAKDALIESLQAEHAEALRAIQQAQTLHHDAQQEQRDTPALESSGQKKSRLQRLKDWFGG